MKRILTNEVYLGHLLQGRTEKVNYKVKKSVEKPKEEWVRVENTHEPIISDSDFEAVQNLLQTDGRVSPESKSLSPFMGLLFAGTAANRWCGAESGIRNPIRCTISVPQKPGRGMQPPQHRGKYFKGTGEHCGSQICQ